MKTTPVPSPIQEELILICEKCGKKLQGAAQGQTQGQSGAENPSVALQQALKSKCIEAYGKNVIRPVLTGCLAVCPQGQITMARMKTETEGAIEFYTVTPPQDQSDLEEAWDWIKK